MNTGRALRLVLQTVGSTLSGDPEHAEVLKLSGLTKAGAKQRLWEQSGLVATRFAAKDYARARHIRGPELGQVEPHTRLPVCTQAEDIGIVVAGGPGTHSAFVPTFGQTRAVTRAVKRSDS